MKNPKINYEEYELTNGECVAMSTAPILMLTLRKSDKKSYETLSKVLVKGVNDKDALEVAEFLYAAYKMQIRTKIACRLQSFLKIWTRTGERTWK